MAIKWIWINKVSKYVKERIIKMPTYQPYATSKNTPSRNARKNARTKTFVFNKTVAAKARKARRLARQQAEEGEE